MTIDKLRCFKCSKPLLPGDKCNRCNPPPLPPVSDDYCAFSANGLRCKNIGDMSPDFDEHATWYCQEHFRTLGDAQLCEAILYSQHGGSHER